MRQPADDHRVMSPTLAHRAEYYSLRAVIAGLEKLSWERACRIGERLGAAGYRPLGIRRRVVERQIAGAFPDLGEAAVARLARASFEHLGRSAVEIALLRRIGSEGVLDLVESVDGWEHVERARAEGSGAVMVCGHHGNWELLGAYVAARGVPVDVIARRMANPLFDAYLNDTRRRLGMTVVYDQDAVRRTPRALREGRAVGFVADQGVLGLASTYVSFFGRPAKTPRGAAVFALRFGSPVLFMDALRQPSGRYRIVIEPVQIEQSGDRERDVDAIVAKFTEQLESWVRRVPEQYFWQHRRWKRQPPGTPPELRDPAAEQWPPE